MAAMLMGVSEMRFIACVLAVGGVLSGLSEGAFGQVVLRSGGVIEAPVVGVGEAGVTVGGDAPRTVSWDRVSRVDGAFAGGAERFSGISEDLWRGRMRLARGDVELARGLFERHFGRYEVSSGETAAFVGVGMLECALAVGDVELAFRAWRLAASQIELGHGEVAVSSMRAGRLIDSESLLCASLHPGMLSVLSEAQVDALDAFADESTRVGRLVGAYLREVDGSVGALVSGVLAEAGMLEVESGVESDEGEVVGDWRESWWAIARALDVGEDAERGELVDAMLGCFGVVYREGGSRTVLGIAAADVLLGRLGGAFPDRVLDAMRRERDRLVGLIERRSGVRGWSGRVAVTAVGLPVGARDGEPDA